MKIEKYIVLSVLRQAQHDADRILTEGGETESAANAKLFSQLLIDQLNLECKVGCDATEIATMAFKMVGRFARNVDSKKGNGS